MCNVFDCLVQVCECTDLVEFLLLWSRCWPWSCLGLVSVALTLTLLVSLTSVKAPPMPLVSDALVRPCHAKHSASGSALLQFVNFLLEKIFNRNIKLK